MIPSKVFWRFQGVQNGNIGQKLANNKETGTRTTQFELVEVEQVAEYWIATGH